MIIFYCLHLYLDVEITLATSGAIGSTILGQDLAPQFDEPYLSNSLEEFWGRRWNLVVTSILRSTVYEPVCCISTPILGKKFGPLPGVFLTFVVSGLMHDKVVKKSTNNRWELNPWVSRVLTIGFLSSTAVWLLFPQIVRNEVDMKVLSEYDIMVEFCKNKLILLLGKPVRNPYAAQ
ncbi:hypothetical protein MKW94_014532 [Papaver nudicaule]|uniref:Wax synthase domain-containing protein n=1 Tax=Papaver nudicaule TaxID=74823 RepID=A0AA41SFY2_PAPNU|nr:hypothetical protein [Papaver nudicaule]